MTHHSSRIKTTRISILWINLFCDTYLAHFVIEQPDFDQFVDNSLLHNDIITQINLFTRKYNLGGNRMSVTCACMDYTSWENLSVVKAVYKGSPHMLAHKSPSNCTPSVKYIRFLWLLWSRAVECEECGNYGSVILGRWVVSQVWRNLAAVKR